MSESMSFELLELHAIEMHAEPKENDSEVDHAGTLAVSFEEEEDRFKTSDEVSIKVEVVVDYRDTRFKVSVGAVVKIINGNGDYEEIIEEYKVELVQPALLKATNIVSMLNNEINVFPILIDFLEIFEKNIETETENE